MIYYNKRKINMNYEEFKKKRKLKSKDYIEKKRTVKALY